MTTQPEALRLADVIGKGRYYERRAAAELRRLHGIEFALRDCEKTLEGMAKKYMDAADQRNELLVALCCVRDMVGHPDNLAFIDAAIKKAEAA